MSFVTGKTALVTGGASGIGLAITQSLLQNGAKGVTVVDIAEECDTASPLSVLKLTFGDKLLYVKTDVRNQLQFEGAFEKAVDKYKSLDIVVNNAGIEDKTNMDKVLEINLGSVMRGTKLAFEKYLPMYKSSEDAAIVNISSIYGIDVEPMDVVYTVSKHGVVGLGKAMNHPTMFGKSKIRVLTVCPGYIDTPMLAIVKHLIPATEISSPDYIGKSVVDLLNNGKRGVWVAENEQPPYEVDFPSRKDLRKVDSS